MILILLSTQITCPIEAVSDIKFICICTQPTQFYNGTLNTCVECPLSNPITNQFDSCSCPMNEIFDFSSQICVCDQISINISNQCVSCLNAEKISEFSCNCTDYDTKFLKCCEPSQYFIDNRCYDCPGVLTNQVCTCLDGWFNQTAGVCHCEFGYFDGKCTECPVKTYLNELRTSCYCENRTFIYNSQAGICECPADMTPIQVDQLICVPCAQNQITDYFGVQVKCECSMINADENCECQGYFDGIQCILCDLISSNLAKSKCQCEPNQEFSYLTKKCECTRPFVQLAQCIKCPLYTDFDNQKCICGKNEVYNDQMNTCDCAGIFDHVCLGCPSFSISAVQSCTCPSQQLFNPLLLKCECVDGQSYVFDGQCVLCPVNSFYSAETLCSCSVGTFSFSLQQCVSCGQFEIFNVSIQKCDCQFSFTNVTNQCVCLQEGYFNGMCTICPLHSTLTQQICVCDTNYVQVQTHCVKTELQHIKTTIVKFLQLEMPNGLQLCSLMTQPFQYMTITNDIDFSQCAQSGFVSLFLHAQRFEGILIDNYIKMGSNGSFVGLIGAYQQNISIKSCRINIQLFSEQLYQISLIAQNVKNLNIYQTEYQLMYTNYTLNVNGIVNQVTNATIVDSVFNLTTYSYNQSVIGIIQQSLTLDSVKLIQKSKSAQFCLYKLLNGDLILSNVEITGNQTQIIEGQYGLLLNSGIDRPTTIYAVMLKIDLNLSCYSSCSLFGDIYRSEVNMTQTKIHGNFFNVLKLGDFKYNQHNCSTQGTYNQGNTIQMDFGSNCLTDFSEE
uniref:Uncharacterized protein n=1 Tax=Trepomonas sp. PC1 TaxID=1076344 RepID=A0A146KHJ0_9EUKA|eukprot:JAP96133.1 Hypothetical protein TPC1_10634 [Trepomonas sp. PC1]